MKNPTETQELPFVECDFNARGWGGEGDACFYAFDQKKLAAISPCDGMLVFLFDLDESDTILGCVGKLQYVTLGSFSGWRAEPIAGTEYRGPMLSILNVLAELNPCVAALRAGGVVAYPTEAVFGLGCDPRNRAAFDKLFALKQRPPTQGVLLIGADFDQVAAYIDLAATPRAAIERAQATWPGPHTWIFPRAADVPDWIAGGHAGIALRVTAHVPAAQLCRAFGGALVSTSANRHGEPPTRTAADVRAAFGDMLDAILNAATGGLERPTPIRDAISGESVRA